VKYDKEMKKAAAKTANNGARRNKAAAEREPTIEEKLRALFATVPKSEMKKIPKDLLVNFDHYLYGFPKRS
jgi:hypothetical protein